MTFDVHLRRQYLRHFSFVTVNYRDQTKQTFSKLPQTVDVVGIKWMPVGLHDFTVVQTLATENPGFRSSVSMNAKFLSSTTTGKEGLVLSRDEMTKPSTSSTAVP